MELAAREEMVDRNVKTLFFDKHIFVHRYLAQVFQQLAFTHQAKIDELNDERDAAGEENEEER